MSNEQPRRSRRGPAIPTALNGIERHAHTVGARLTDREAATLKAVAAKRGLYPTTLAAELIVGWRDCKRNTRMVDWEENTTQAADRAAGRRAMTTAEAKVQRARLALAVAEAELEALIRLEGARNPASGYTP